MLCRCAVNPKLKLHRKYVEISTLDADHVHHVLLQSFKNCGRSSLSKQDKLGPSDQVIKPRGDFYNIPLPI